MRLLIVILLLVVGLSAVAQDNDGGLAKIKELELREVRDRIAELKKSMDRRAQERDRVTADLQAADVAIAEMRQNLKDIERQLAYSENRKAELESTIAQRESELAEETGQLEAQARAAYMNGGQERLRLLLNQQDPATLGRQLKYYEYLSRYRAGNIESVTARLTELAALREEVERETASRADEYIVRLPDYRRGSVQRLQGQTDLAGCRAGASRLR